MISSCTREQVIDNLSFPAAESKAAIYCILTPGDSVFLGIKTLQPINAESKYSTVGIATAQVIIENTTTHQQARMVYIGRDGLYGCSQRNMPVLADNNYQLIVTIPNSSVLKSSCHIPVQAASVLTSAYGEPYTDIFSQYRRVTLTWHDVSFANTQYNYFLAEKFIHKQPSSGELDTLRGFDLNGEITQSNGMIYYNGRTLDSGYPHTYYLYTSDSNLFKFLKMSKQMEHTLTSRGATDFFGAYPGVVPEFTNVENGYGVFGAYLRTEKEVIFQ